MIYLKWRAFLFRVHVGRQVYTVRRARGATRAQLARFAGIGAFKLFLFENGLISVSVDELIRLKNALCCSFSVLMG